MTTVESTARIEHDWLWDEGAVKDVIAQLVKGRSLREATRAASEAAQQTKMLSGEGVYQLWPKSGRIDGAIQTEDGPITFERGKMRVSEEGDIQSGPVTDWQPAFEAVDLAIQDAAQNQKPTDALSTLGEIWRRLEDTVGTLITHTRAVWPKVDPEDRAGVLRAIPVSLRDQASLHSTPLPADLCGDSSDVGPAALPWLAEAIKLEAAGQGEQSLDIIFDQLDDWLLDEQFGTCSSFLGEVKVGVLSTAQLLTILTATWPASAKLPERAAFFGRVRAALRDRGKDTDALLSGLEG